MEPRLTRCERAEQTCAYALQALAPAEAHEVLAHIGACSDCQRELEGLRPVLARLVAWPTDILRPTGDLGQRLAERIAEEGTAPAAPLAACGWSEPAWARVAPGIECQLFATDPERRRVSMLVRLAPGASYPAHTHADVEELHLLEGELWIDDRRLEPGDYNVGAPGASDYRVWSETGCTCLLVTSSEDRLHPS